MQKLSEKEIHGLTNEIHSIANECAMHGWDYRPLLKANQLLEAFAFAPQSKKWVAEIKTTQAMYEGDLVEWNVCDLYAEPVSDGYMLCENEVIIEATSRDEAFQKMIEAYCPNETEIRLTATGHFKLQNK
jgi:hypothetical protein